MAESETRLHAEKEGYVGEHDLLPATRETRRDFRLEAEAWVTGAPTFTGPAPDRIEVETVAGRTLEAPPTRLTPGGTVEGIVRDQAGAPLAGRRVSVRYREHRGLMAETADDGTFRIEHVPPGRHPITAAIHGASRARGRVKGDEGAATWIALQPE